MPKVEKVDCPSCNWRRPKLLEHASQLEYSAATARALAESTRSPKHKVTVIGDGEEDRQIDELADALTDLLTLPPEAIAVVLRRCADRTILRGRRDKSENVVSHVKDPRSKGVVHWRERESESDDEE